MKTYVKRWFDIPLYGGNLLVCVSDKWIDERRKAEDLFGEWEGGDPKGPDAAAASWGLPEPWKHAVWIFPNCGTDTIAHEAVHVALRVAQYRIGPDDYTTSAFHEMVAYLTGWVTKTVLDCQLRAKQLKKIK